MSCRTETKDIDDVEYSVRQWSAEKAMIMKFKLAKTFGVAITALASTANIKDDKDSVKAISEGLNALFSNSSPEEVTALMKSCIVGVARGGTKITDTSFNEVFNADDLITVYKIFIFVIQVNFGNLLKGQLVDNLLAKMKVNL